MSETSPDRFITIPCPLAQRFYNETILKLRTCASKRHAARPGCGEYDLLHAIAGVNPKHVHFIDGARGGYPLAATALKESSARE